jgi:hypothetical protein
LIMIFRSLFNLHTKKAIFKIYAAIIASQMSYWFRTETPYPPVIIFITSIIQQLLLSTETIHSEYLLLQVIGEEDGKAFELLEATWLHCACFAYWMLRVTKEFWG